MAEIKLACPHCAQRLSIDTEYCGRQVLCPTCNRDFLVPPLARTPPPVATVTAIAPAAVAYAGFWRRFAASLIDTVILTVLGTLGGGFVGFFLGAVLGGSGVNLETIGAVCGGFGYVIGIILNWLYFTLFESSKKQATLGKMALGILVTDIGGNRITFGRANGRYWGKMVSALILLVGYLMVAFTQQKQALHDMMAGCLVVRQ